MLGLQGLAPIELRHFKGCLGGRVRDVLARGLVAKSRKVGELAPPPLAHRLRQPRFTGAIERHPSPLSVVWGVADPIAVAAMASRLVDARPDTTLAWLEGVGHYPMIEAPDRFLDAVTTALA